jgi:predicted GNAT superfamily acetyltransferase
MAVLEIHTFELISRVAAADFRALDERMQEWCYLNRPGIARRTTARTEAGRIVVVTLFDTAEQAQHSFLASKDALVIEWLACVQPDTSSTTVYSLL